jgi:outer membrane protein TolC
MVALSFGAENPLFSQCAGIASIPERVADCAAHSFQMITVATIDPSRPYGLAELIDIAEQNNPQTRIVWERAKQRAEDLGVAKSAYYPVLAGVARLEDGSPDGRQQHRSCSSRCDEGTSGGGCSRREAEIYDQRS